MNEDDEGTKKEENDDWSESHDTICEVEYNLSPKSGGKPFQIHSWRTMNEITFDGLILQPHDKRSCFPKRLTDAITKMIPGYNTPSIKWTKQDKFYFGPSNNPF